MSYHSDLAAHYRDVRSRTWPKPDRPSAPEKRRARPLTIVEAVGVPLNLLLIPNWRSIVKLVALRRQMKVADLLGDARDAKIVEARHEAIHLIYTHCGLSLLQVGRCFNRDHTSILHAVKKVERARDRRVMVPAGSRERYKNKSSGPVVIRVLRTPSTAEHANVSVTAGRQASTPSPTVTNISTSAGARGDA